MIPERNDVEGGSAATLMSNEKETLTLSNAAINQGTGRNRSGTKRCSYPGVTGSIGHLNPWGHSMRESVASIGNRSKNHLPGGVNEIGKGLSRELTQLILIVKDPSTIVSMSLQYGLV